LPDVVVAPWRIFARMAFFQARCLINRATIAGRLSSECWPSQSYRKSSAHRCLRFSVLCFLTFLVPHPKGCTPRSKVRQFRTKHDIRDADSAWRPARTGARPSPGNVHRTAASGARATHNSGEWHCVTLAAMRGWWREFRLPSASSPASVASVVTANSAGSLGEWQKEGPFGRKVTAERPYCTGGS